MILLISFCSALVSSHLNFFVTAFETFYWRLFNRNSLSSPSIDLFLFVWTFSNSTIWSLLDIMSGYSCDYSSEIFFPIIRQRFVTVRWAIGIAIFIFFVTLINVTKLDFFIWIRFIASSWDILVVFIVQSAENNWFSMLLYLRLNSTRLKSWACCLRSTSTWSWSVLSSWSSYWTLWTQIIQNRYIFHICIKHDIWLNSRFLKTFDSSQLLIKQRSILAI